MKRFVFGLLAIFCAIGASTAHAGIAWDYNFSAFSGGTVANLNDITSATYQATSILGFRGPTSAASPIQAGDTFQDYALVRFTSFTDTNGDVINMPTGATLTAEFVFNGVQLTSANGSNPGEYAITNMQVGNFYFNYGAGASTSQTNLGNWVAGQTVEQVTGLGPSGGTNNNNVAPNGSQNMTLVLNDAPNGQPHFETDTNGNALANNLTTFVLGLVSGSNQANPPGNGQVLGRLNDGSYATTGSTLTQVQPGSGSTVFTKQFADVFSSFGLSGSQQDPTSGVFTNLKDNNGSFNFGFQTFSSGSLTKDIVPEPSSSALFAGVMAIGGCLLRRRRK